MNLILFTASYPYVYGNETSFLSVEVQYLSKAFDRVVVVPEILKEPTPVGLAGIGVDISYAQAIASKSMAELSLLAFSSKIFRQGFMEHGFPRFSMNSWRRLVAFSGKAELTRRWVLDFLPKNNLAPQDCIFYTYWLDHAAAGIGLAKQHLPGLTLVSRAHGYDIYEEHYYDPPFWPCRQTVLKNMDRVFADSHAGTVYLINGHPDFADIFETALLGVRDPGFLTSQSTDQVFRVVSCSRVSAEKRIELLLDGIAIAARQKPDQRFEWHHFGNGDKREQLQQRADESFPPNAKGFLPGFSDGASLMNFYRTNPIDVFVNSSSTEGTSVAIMEAISCGIPVLATNVGGNAEIVSGQNGILIPAESSPGDIAAAFFSLMDDAKMLEKRIESRKKWAAEYDADVNFLEFTRKLASIKPGKTRRF